MIICCMPPACLLILLHDCSMIASFSAGRAWRTSCWMTSDGRV